MPGIDPIGNQADGPDSSSGEDRRKKSVVRVDAKAESARGESFEAIVEEPYAHALAVIESNSHARVREFIEGYPDELSAAPPSVKAGLIRVLQQGGTAVPDEKAILAILECATRADRAAVFQLVNAGDDKYDLEKLLYRDIDDATIRARIKEMIVSSAPHRRDDEPVVISDFDDTAVPYKHAPHGKRYPGAAALYRALEGDTPGDVHYVTARPAIIGGNVRGDLAKRGFPSGPVKFGRFGKVVFGGEDGIESAKIEDIERLLELKPNQRVILFGDSTQKDPEVYRQVMERHPERIAAAFIHNASAADPEDPRFNGMHLVKNHVHAASLLADQGIISQEQLHSIVRQAIEEGMPEEDARKWVD